jgi:hypothetical protein
LNPGTFRCADYSLSHEEQLFGTANPIDLWVLIEHRGRWEHDVWSSVPQSTKSYLADLRTSFPRLRFAFIRQNTRTTGPLAGFIARSCKSKARLFGFELDSLEELRSIAECFDFQASDPTGVPLSRKLFCVCTHGTHDGCCARYGSGVYEATSRLEGDDVWQISHVGGCRFAPNLVCLPHGLVYGQLQAADCSSVVTAYREGRIYLERLRGRSCHERPVQAAEYFLRTALQLRGLDELNVTSFTSEANGQWKIVFESVARKRHEVILTSEPAPQSTYKNCAATQLSPRERFTLIACT